MLATCHLAIAVGEGIIPIVVYRIVWLHTLGILHGIFAANNGFGHFVNIVSEHLEMFMLDNPRIRHIAVGVVNDRITLIIRNIKHLCLETHRSVFESSKAIVKEAIYRPRIDQLIGVFAPHSIPRLKKIAIGLDITSPQQPLDKFVVSAARYSLISIIEIVVVVGEPQRKTTDDKSRQLRTFPPPLLFGISFYQGGIYIPGDEFEFAPVDCVFTHFPADEDKTLDLGRLGEECKRFKEIFDGAGDGSLILLNETFSTTSFEEGYYIARDSVRAILTKGTRTIYNTHMHKLGFDVDEMNEGRTEGKVYSLIVHNEGSQRSYKIEIAPPAGRSYASDIAEKYGVTYDMLVNKEK